MPRRFCVAAFDLDKVCADGKHASPSPLHAYSSIASPSRVRNRIINYTGWLGNQVTDPCVLASSIGLDCPARVLRPRSIDHAGKFIIKIVNSCWLVLAPPHSTGQTGRVATSARPDGFAKRPFYFLEINQQSN